MIPVFGIDLAIDAVLVVIFSVIGRASHHEPLDLAGIATVAWPFLLALLLAHFVSRRIPREHLARAIVIWLVTWVFGIGLRLAAGTSAAIAFIIVAGVVLGAFLVGWRLLAKLFVKRPDAETQPVTDPSDSTISKQERPR